MRSPAAVATVFLLTSAFFWGTAFRATLIGAEHSPTMTFTALRAAPAAIALLIIALLVRSRLPRGQVLVWASATGFLMITIALAGLAESVTRAGAGNAAVVSNTVPFFVILIAPLLLGEHASRVGIGGLVLGFAGIVLMVSSQLGGVESTGEFLLGLVFAFASATSWALGTVLVKRMMRERGQIDLVGFTAVQYVIGSLLLVLLAIAIDSPGETDWSSGELWAAVAWVSLGSSVLATLAYFGALKRLPASRVAAWGFAAPVVAVLVEIGRGDVPQTIVLAGMILAIAGLGITNAAPIRQADPAIKPLRVTRAK